MLERDALLSKLSIIRNCLRTIRKVESEQRGRLEDFLVDDIQVLNLERAIQSCIDTAHIIIAHKGLTLPATYRQSFQILVKENLLPKDLGSVMEKMVGFRNVAAHTYQEINPAILHSIVANHLGDLETFVDHLATLIAAEFVG